MSEDELTKLLGSIGLHKWQVQKKDSKKKKQLNKSKFYRTIFFFCGTAFP